MDSPAAKKKKKMSYHGHKGMWLVWYLLQHIKQEFICLCS
jgi:hypothetical protein